MLALFQTNQYDSWSSTNFAVLATHLWYSQFLPCQPSIALLEQPQQLLQVAGPRVVTIIKASRPLVATKRSTISVAAKVRAVVSSTVKTIATELASSTKGQAVDLVLLAFVVAVGGTSAMFKSKATRDQSFG